MASNELTFSVVNKKVAHLDDNFIVCDNSGYIATFDLDSEWDNQEVITVYFKYGEGDNYTPVVLNQLTMSCSVPTLADVSSVMIGLSAGNIKTSMEAVVDCRESIKTGLDSIIAPTEDIYDQVVDSIKTPYIGEDGYWYLWSGTSRVFVKSSIRANGSAVQIDDVPTEGSENPVKSGGVAAELAKKPYVMTGTGAPLTTIRMPDGSLPPKGTIYFDTTTEYLVPYVANIVGEGVAVSLRWDALQVTANRVTSITDYSTDIQYPTAKAVWTLCDEILQIPVASNMILGGIKVGENLKIDENGVLSVDTATDVEQDNTKPVTSAAVHVQLGNVEVLLSTL